MDTETSRPDPNRELKAMQAVADALRDLDPEVMQRVLRWAAETFNLGPSTPTPTLGAQRQDAQASNGGDERPEAEYADLATFFAAASPATGPERALVVAYWIQTVQGNSEFDTFAVSSELKNMGHPLANVTVTIASLMTQRPQLIIQTRKVGKAQQARKRYRLTGEGIRRVRQMLTQTNG
jgi:hypothetical protein